LVIFPPQTWIGFLYLALVSQLFGFFLWNAGLALGGIARVSLTQLVQPFVTIVASALLLGETIEPSSLAFAFVVISLVAVGRGMRITLGPYWGDRLNRSSLCGHQASARGGVACLRLGGDRIVLKGRAVTTLKGELHV
jgi:hypothetical protein